MKLMIRITLCMLLIGGNHMAKAAAVAEHEHEKFDLTKLKAVAGCLAKGRFQDKEYNDSSAVVEQIISGGKRSIPVLIEMIPNSTKTDKPVFCFWPETTIGDLAFFMLADLFLDASWQHSTVPGASLQELLGPEPKGTPYWEHYRAYLQKHGRRELEKKWKKIWIKYENKVEWDPNDRCFKLVRGE